MKKILGLLAISALLTGCASGMSPVGYALFTNVDGPITATDHVASAKNGSACATNVLGIVGAGDASINTAKRNGGISKIATADYSSSGIYPFFGRTCVNVTGE
ncbi:TRL-like family protein [Entomomonas asaccharolytica]|uniref:TRL-like family protein n=1 Tax=Entomomonas asaccharolytica TaxID=2785331 RepID=A0A974RW32_9GAMM|nr:TRL-like family protein [Entomomonas asaccharolytica]QQP84652.1 TRL-like family protein [Entomomonas asaccharolytica]